jgi:hypothetical protein
MPTADREYDTEAFVENLSFLLAQGSTSATLPEMTGHDHPSPAGGHPLINIESLQKRLFDAPPGITIPLNDDASLTVRKLPGGGIITFQTTF